MRAALQKLEEGCSVDDAKAVCQPEVLNQMLKWKVVVDSQYVFLFFEVFLLVLLSLALINELFSYFLLWGEYIHAFANSMK